MKTKLTFLIALLIICVDAVLLSQSKQTYEINGTKYIYNESYSTTRKPKVQRNSSAKKEFLKSRGYDKVPKGFEVDHIIPLSEGGTDQPYNMQLISTEQHKAKTAREKASNSVNSTYVTPSYKNSSTYKKSDSYSTPSYSNSSGKTIHTGPKGGQYYINSYGNKTYIKKK